MSELSEKQVMEAYRDPAWRLQNLYRIVTKDDGVATFSPNRAQRRVLNDLHNRNVILKARQLGFCLDPSTRVLTADLRWVRIDHLTIGDELVACDENIPGGRGADRKMRTATVEGMSLTERESYRITFDDGRQVVCSGDHRWLSKNVATQAKWRAINCQNGTRKKLRVGHKVRWITKPWGDGDIEDGWFGGMLDGEGSIAKDNTQASVNVSQREGGVWDRLVAYSRERGYNARIENDSAGRSNKYGREPVPKLVFGRLDEIFRLVGQTRPTRFIGNRFWEGRSMPGKKSGVGWATITSIEKVGARKLVDIQTSTGTFIAEGFVSHNSTLVAILWLDTALFSDNPITCAVIAQDRDTAGKLFEKITFAYDGLPKVLRDMFPLERRTTEEIAFEHNKSSIRVATSARGGTIHRLHVSEMGKIGAANPKKAKEIVTGSIPAVPEAGIVVVESTAEGRSGRYYDLVQGAKAAKDSGRPLAPQDYKLHFFAWWEDPGYTADPSQVALSDSDKSYFLEVEGIIGRSLLPEQKAWYAATLRGTFAGDRPLMWQEYPSHIDEPFKVSLDGAYYAAQIADARKQGRIGVVPLESGVPVNTFWDLGLNDNTAIWCHQRVGLQNRFVRFYKNSGEPLAHYAQWLLELGVVFGTHYLPHDAGAQRYGINPDNNDSVEDMLRKLLPGHRFEIVPRVTRVLSGIHATRQALSSCWFDETGCSEGVADLEAYRKAWDESRGTWKDQPHHGPESDGADAFRMFGQVAQSGGRFATSVAPPRGGRRGAVTRRGGPMAV